MNLAEKIMAYAKAHYEDGLGWDTVVECSTLAELEGEIAESGITSVKAYYDLYVEPHHNYAEEIRAEIF